jgi:major intracellular serine protease
LGRGGKFPYDWGGHGTSIASVVSQISPEVEMMVVKVFDQETMFHAPFSRWNMYLIAAGINWAARNGADVISLSVALKKNHKEIRDASEYCWRHNITIICAAGNVEDENPELSAYYPASYPWSIGVGGVEKKDGKLKVWRHSARGNFIDVVAPAAEILVESPSYLDKRSWPTRVSGNSLAVPIVAATTALILSAMSPETKQILKDNPGALVEVTRSILKETSSNQKLGFTKPNPASGFGLINAYRAAKRAGNID